MPNFTPVPSKYQLNLFGIIFIFIIIIVLGAGVWFAARWFKKNEPAQQSQAAIMLDTVQVIKNIQKLIVLPANENPTIVQIENVDDLKREQPFYRDAKNGDWVAVYLQAKKAVIYDATNNILVNVGPIYLDNATAPTATTTVATSTAVASGTVPAATKLTVEIRNGSGQSGWAAATADKLKGNSAFEVTRVVNANGSGYEGVTIVNLVGAEKIGAVKELKDLLNAAVVSAIPKGEAATTADVLVIAGK